MPSMGLLRSLCFAAALLAGRAFAETVLDASKLSSCVMNCPTINAANSVCVPPATTATNQATYQSCFCQSAYLTTLYTTPAGICDTCTADETAKMQQWYVGLCRGGVVVTPASSGSAATTSAGAAASASASGAAGSSAGKSSHGSWISSHWKWVLLLIVVFTSMIGFGTLGVILRRRHERKRDLARANVAATSASGAIPSPPRAPRATAAGGAGVLAANSFSNSHYNPPRTQTGLPEMSNAERARNTPTPTQYPAPYPPSQSQSQRPRPPIIPPSGGVPRGVERTSPVSPVERTASPAAAAAAQAATKGKGRVGDHEKEVR